MANYPAHGSLMWDEPLKVYIDEVAANPDGGGKLLLLDNGAPVPPDTAPGTVIFEKS